MEKKSWDAETMVSAARETVQLESRLGPHRRFERSEGWWLVGLFGLAIGLRWVAVFRIATIFNDGPTFLAIAAQMASGNWSEAFSHDYHPLYPFLIQAAGRWVADPATAALSISVLSGSLAVVALYAFLRQIWSRELATVGAFFLAVHPYAIRFSADVQSDALYTMLFLVSVALVYRELERPRFALALSAGVALGLAYLTRPEGLVVGLAAVTAGGVLWLRRFWPSGTSLVALAGFFIGIAVSAFPYIFMLHSVTGSWQLSQKKSILVLLGLMQRPAGRGSDFFWSWGAEPLGIGLALAGFLLVFCYGGWALRRSGALGEVFSPGRLWLLVLLGLLCLAVLWGPILRDFLIVIESTLRPELLVLFILGVWAGALHTGRSGSLLMGFLMTTYGLMLFALLLHYGYLSRRHLLPPLTLLMGYCAVGASFAANWLAGLRVRGLHGSRPWALALVLALVAAISLPKAWDDHRGEEWAGRLAAEWLRDASLEPGLLASERSKLGYYANRGWRALVVDGEHRPVGALYREGVRFVVFEGEPKEHWSAMGGAPAGVALVERQRVEARDHVAFLIEIMEQDSAP